MAASDPADAETVARAYFDAVAKRDIEAMVAPWEPGAPDVMANGATVDLQGCDVLTVRDGRIQRNDAYLNGAEMARQLGALPPAGSAPEKAMTAAINLKTRLAAWLAARRA